ncbi:hypothetical protein CJJ07_001559 [Candidozyma auris]|nr:hypothetical protein CJJ07_001559 [[Candida] auris]
MMSQPSQAIEIELPEMAVLCTKGVSICALNGSIMSCITGSDAFKYTETIAKTAASFVISSTNSSMNLHKLKTSASERWKVNTKYLAAWTTSKPSYDSFNNMVTIQEDSEIILKEEGQVISINLGDREHILVKPSAVVAYNVLDRSVAIRYTGYTSKERKADFTSASLRLVCDAYEKSANIFRHSKYPVDLIRISGPGVLLLKDHL